MTDPETQFRETLRRIDEVEAPVPPIESDAIRRLAAASRRHPPGRVVAAAAAVVIVAGAAAAVVAQRPVPVTGTPAPAPSATVPTADGATGTATAPSTVTSSPTLPSPPTGLVWVGTEGWTDPQAVWVAVPTTWGRAESWNADYCFIESRPAIPDRPYVDTNHGYAAGHAITCPALAARQQQPHVSVVAPDKTSAGFPWDGNTPGWSQWSTTVDGITVTVTAPEGQRELARRILDTVHVFG